MIQLTSLLKAKWMPYVAFFWAASVGGVGLYSYMKGKEVVEKRMAKEIAKALEAQMEELERVHAADLETLVHSLASEQEISGVVENIQLPDVQPDCERALYDWMRQFDPVIRTANSARPAGTD